MRARNLTAKGRKNREGDGTGPDGGEEGAPGGSEHRTGAEGVGGWGACGREGLPSPCLCWLIHCSRFHPPVSEGCLTSMARGTGSSI